MGWDGPILTDSGGFQLFSLAAHQQGDRGGGRLPLAHRRPAAGTSRRSGPWPSKRPWAATWRWCWTTWCALPNAAGGRPRRDRADASAGPPAAAMRPGGATRPCSPSSRAGWTPSCASLVPRQLRRAGFRRLRGRRAERRRDAGRDVPHPRRHRARTARRPAAVPDGRGPAGGPAGGGRPGHRPVRLRHAHPQRPQRHGLYRRRADAAAEPAIRAGSTGRWKRAAPARPAAAAAATCATCSWPAKCSARSCCRSTT